VSTAQIGLLAVDIQLHHALILLLTHLRDKQRVYQQEIRTVSPTSPQTQGSVNVDRFVILRPQPKNLTLRQTEILHFVQDDKLQSVPVIRP
jgi:hypothetical protein